MVKGMVRDMGHDLRGVIRKVDCKIQARDVKTELTASVPNTSLQTSSPL
jgi:hypothetical protein